MGAAISVLFFILKIILIIILAIIAIILIVAAVIIISPIKYSVLLEKSQKMQCIIKVTWIYKIISINYEFDNNTTNSIIRIAGFKIGKDKSKSEDINKKNEHKDVDMGDKEEETNFESDVHPKYDSSEASTGDDFSKELIKSKNQDESSESGETDKRYTKEKRSDKLKNSKSTLTQKKKDKDKSKKTEKNGLFQKIKNIKNQLKSMGLKKIIKKLFETLKAILKKIRPKKFYANIEVGTGDPANTGFLLGAIYMFSGITSINNLNVLGNFEKAIFSGTVNAYGKFRILNIIVPFIKFIFYKPVWKEVKKQLFRKEGKKNV